jgi:lysophospholipase L1-like esterase
VITIEVERDPLAVRLGALGDSLTDEYEFEGNRNYASNWIELLNSEFGVDVGTSGNRSAPRRSGFEYNWALSGATSDSLIEDGQHTGLAAQAMSGDVSHAFLLIGQNDFRDIVLDVVLGNFSAAEETAFVNTVVANITTAVDTLLATDVALVLSNLIDYSVAPLIRDNVPLILRNQLTNVVVRVNDELADLAEDRQIPLLDSFAFSKSIFGTNSNPNETVTLCGVEFDNSEGDGTATDLNLFTEDGIHPHTAAQAVIANAIVEAFNLGHGTNLPQFSECDIVSLVGATGTGENSLDIDYSEFVTLPNVL